MWLNLQISLLWAFAINFSSGELPVPGLKNFLTTSMLNYESWLFNSGFDPSEKIPFVDLTDHDFDPKPYPKNYTAIGNLTNHWIEGHSNVENVEVQANKTHFSIWYEISAYLPRGPYVLEGSNDGITFKGAGEFTTLCNSGFVSLTCKDVGLTPDGFLDLSLATFTMVSDFGNPNRCWTMLKNFAPNEVEYHVTHFAEATYYKRMMEEDLSPLPYYLKLFLEQLFKSTPKNVIANATLPPDFINTMKRVSDRESGTHGNGRRPLARHVPVLRTAVVKLPLKNLPVPGLQNFLTISMLKYSDWLLEKGLDPSEKIPFVDITDREDKENYTLAGNITNSRIHGHSYLRIIDVHATESNFSIYIDLENYSQVGSYSIEGILHGTTFNGSANFKMSCISGYVFIAAKNIEVRGGYLDLSTAFIRTNAMVSPPGGCFDLLKNITWTPGLDIFKLTWQATKTFNKRMIQEGLSPLPGYLKMYLEELFRTTTVDVIAKTTLPPELASYSGSGAHQNTNNVVPGHSNPSKKPAKNNFQEPEENERGRASSFYNLYSLCWIFAAFLFIL